MEIIQDFFLGENWIRNLLTFSIAVLGLIASYLKLFKKKKESKNIKKAVIEDSVRSKIKQSGSGALTAHISNSKQSQINQ